MFCKVLQKYQNSTENGNFCGLARNFAAHGNGALLMSRVDKETNIYVEQCDWWNREEKLMY